MDDLQNYEPWLVLQSLPGIGLHAQHELIQHFGHPNEIFTRFRCFRDKLKNETRNCLDQLHIAWDKSPLVQQARKTLDYCHTQDVQLVHCLEPGYPASLKVDACHPLLLFIKGSSTTLHDHQLGVVGARKCSRFGAQTARAWSEELARAGLCITSGLAIGIDSEAHRGALYGEGKTIAVLAHGIDQVYPKRNQLLAAEIVERGALVTEFLPGMPPQRNHFPRRNRIISGMSFGLLVIEAAEKSGSLVSARYAIEFNREVFAIPGSINNQQVKGCHRLIKDGAYLVDSVEDILEYARWQGFVISNKELEPDGILGVSGTSKQPLPVPASDLLATLDFSMMHMDEIVERNRDKSLAELSGLLLLLEAEGFVEQSVGLYQRIR